MQTGYCIFSWPVDDTAKTTVVTQWIAALQAQSSDWRQVFSADGVRVLLRQPTEGSTGFLRLPTSRGVVLGTLFRKQSGAAHGSPMSELDDADQNRLQTNPASGLIENYWGRYVAVIIDKDRRTVSVLRDPSGGLPCFTCSVDGISITVSNVPDLAAIGSFQPCFNQRFLIETLFSVEMVSRQTGLETVQEILPGEAAVHSHEGIKFTPLWDPLRFCETGKETTFDQAVAELRDTTMSCVNSWAAAYDSIYLNLSGGLDSAIVLACLADGQKRDDVTCLNYFTSAAEGDERLYAAEAAEQAGTKFVEIAMPQHHDLASLVSHTQRSARPTGDIFAEPTARQLINAAQPSPSDAFFSGEGGDQLFFAIKTPLVAADYWRAKGLSKGLFSVFLDVAHLTGQTVWHVLSQTLRHDIVNRQASPLPVSDSKASRLLVNGTRAHLGGPYSDQFWCGTPGPTPPAKWLQVYTLLQSVQRRKSHLYHQAADLRNPLISQPLMELCLSLPTYVLAQGGQGRSLARAAFRDAVPDSIIRRVNKGSTEPYFHKLMALNKKYIHDLILDGHLVSSGLLDQDQTAAFMNTSHVKDGEAIRLILKLVAIESWIGAWSSAPSDQ